MKQAAYSILEIKSLGTDEQRVITGRATSPVPDRVGDVIDPFGVQVAADIPLFLYHDTTKTVGRARFGKPTKDGIPFTAELPKITEPGVLKDRVDEAWQMLRTGLLRGVSIGFRVIGDAFERIAGGGTRYSAVEILELSLVPVPMHQLATVETVKAAADLAIRRAHNSPANRSRGKEPMNFAVLTLNSQLELSLTVGHDTTKTINLALSRIMAQRLADELQSFATNRKGIDGRRELTFALEVLPVSPSASQARSTRSTLRLGKASAGRSVVQLDRPSSSAHPGSVYIGTPANKKAGVMYLDSKPSGTKRPVVRLNPKR